MTSANKLPTKGGGGMFNDLWGTKHDRMCQDKNIDNWELFMREDEIFILRSEYLVGKRFLSPCFNIPSVYEFKSSSFACGVSFVSLIPDTIARAVLPFS